MTADDETFAAADSSWPEEPPLPEDEPPYSDPTRERTNAFELLVDYVRAQREAPPSDKWYGDWDDTYLQYAALHTVLNTYADLSRDQLDDEYAKFRTLTANHLHACPLVSTAVEPPGPNLGPLTSYETAQLRERAAILRTPEGAEPDLTKTANEALAALYDAHANLGEAL